MDASPRSGDTNSHLRQYRIMFRVSLCKRSISARGSGIIRTHRRRTAQRSPDLLFTHASQRDSRSGNMGTDLGRRYPRSTSGRSQLLKRCLPLEFFAETDSARNGPS